MSILDKIVAQKRLEVEALRQIHDLQALRRQTKPGKKRFYDRIGRFRAEQKPFFIAEFKRKSPSEGWIQEHADLHAQLRAYAREGAGAVSVLTDAHFFGGSYADLAAAARELSDTDVPVLQKDFVVDPIQILLARQAGADIILLIAAILEPDQLEALRREAENLGMGVLVEVRDTAEYERIRQLDFPVLGVNNRDLSDFSVHLNRFQCVARAAGNRFLIAESGIHDYRDIAITRGADGFLVGTSLMRQGSISALAGGHGMRSLFKACGMRAPEHLALQADFLGINFSPLSKRRMADTDLRALESIPSHAVAVFYKNSEAEIRQILSQYPFRFVQVYAGDASPAFVRSLKQRVLLACKVENAASLSQAEAYADTADLFILDGAEPGSGRAAAVEIPIGFPYPFLLAGGMHAGNLQRVLDYENCIGVDVASGIETGGAVDPAKVRAIVQNLKRPEALPFSLDAVHNAGFADTSAEAQ